MYSGKEGFYAYQTMMAKFTHGRNIFNPEDDDTDIPREELRPEPKEQTELFVDTREAEVKEREMVVRYLDRQAANGERVRNFGAAALVLELAEDIRRGKHLEKGGK